MNINNHSNNTNNNLMDFKVLSKYDDLFTDVFLDNLHLWFDTIKMNDEHRRPRVPNAKILSIIQKNILENSRLVDAINEILEIDYFKHYLSLKNPKQIQEFVQHMKRYLYMYMPNAGYEVSDTNRYSDKRVEACLVATKDWHVGDEMRFLTGMIATLDPEDDAELKKGNRDFSVMWSARKNCTCLFLGPARFANHDCDSNCQFIAHGPNSIIFKVVKEIKCGDEITVFYGNHYFGENNCECKCITCEKRGTGYFTIPSTTEGEDTRTNKRPTRTRKPPVAHEDYIQITTSRRTKRTVSQLEEEDRDKDRDEEGEANKKIKMSIDFICNHESNSKSDDTTHLNLLVNAAVMETKYLPEKNQDELTIVVNPDLYPSHDSPPLSTKADSAVSLSPKTEKKEFDDFDYLDPFLDDVSDLSSVSSSVFDEEEEELQRQKNDAIKKAKKEKDLSCIACKRPLQDIPQQVGAETHELATWTWSPSAVFTDWCPKRCPRCERHFIIFRQEWPNRKQKKTAKKSKRKKLNKKIIDLPPAMDLLNSQLNTPSELTPSSEYAPSPSLAEEIEL